MEEQRGEHEERDGIWSKLGDSYSWQHSRLRDSETKTPVHSFMSARARLLQLSWLVPWQSFAAPVFLQCDWTTLGFEISVCLWLLCKLSEIIHIKSYVPGTHSQCPITVSYSYCFEFVLCKYKSIGVHIWYLYEQKAKEPQRTVLGQSNGNVWCLSLQGFEKREGRGLLFKHDRGQQFDFHGSLSLCVCVWRRLLFYQKSRMELTPIVCKYLPVLS